MTATLTNTMFTILDREFDIDELRYVVNHGMSAGVSGFIYFHECVDKFDMHDDEIQDYLSDWVYDHCNSNGGNRSSFEYFASGAEDITQLKQQLVWSYVELKTMSPCSLEENDPLRLPS